MQDKRKTNINQNLLVKFGNILHFVIKTEKVLPKSRTFLYFTIQQLVARFFL
jgi:hypothetical protein